VAKSADKFQPVRRKIKPEDQMTWKDLEIGAIATEPGSADYYGTGDWRSRRPTYDFSKCIHCALCQTYCPDGCIHQNPDGTYEADLFYCKGCGICARECPKQVITMVEEKE
jgi:pyruvate ferredoxin oxidoreductase delta subunit